MKITTFLKKSSVCLLFAMAAGNAWSFGGDEVRRSRCVEPRFKNIKPPKLIGPGGEFSFTASTNTVPESITVTVKGYKADLTVEDDYGYQVKGNMPPELTEGYALIKIKANSRPSSCVAEDAWLVKIVEEQGQEQVPVQQQGQEQEQEQEQQQEQEQEGEGEQQQEQSQ